MKTQNTDKATARPWQATRVNQQYGCYGWAINRKGFDVEGNSQGQGRTIAWIATDGDEARAEAALIVQAVNEHAALVAVAEAAQIALAAIPAPFESHSEAGKAYWNLRNKVAALANLAAVQGGAK